MANNNTIISLGDMLATAKLDLEDQRSKDDLLMTQVAELSEEMSDLNNKVTGVSEESADSDDVEAIMESISDLQAKSDECKVMVMDNRVSIEDLQAMLDMVKSDDQLETVQDMVSMIKESYSNLTMHNELADMVSMLKVLAENHSEVLDNLSSDVDFLQETSASYQDLSDRVDLLRTDIINGQTVTEVLANDLQDQKAMLDMVKATYVNSTVFAQGLSGLDGSIQMLNQFKEVTDAAILDQGVRIDGQAVSLGNLEAMVDMLKATSVTSDQLAPLQNQLDSADQSVAALSSDQAAQASAISSLESSTATELSNVNNMLSMLKASRDNTTLTLEDHLERIILLEADAAALESTDGVISASVDGLVLRADALEARATRVDASVGSLCETVTNITSLSAPVHSSTSRRWFLEDLKGVQDPTCV